MRPAVTLVSAWVSQVARDARIDTALLATRADLVAMLRDDPDAKLAHGWRAELLGDGITRLLDGRSALTFDGKGSLRLVDVLDAAGEALERPSCRTGSRSNDAICPARACGLLAHPDARDARLRRGRPGRLTSNVNALVLGSPA